MTRSIVLVVVNVSLVASVLTTTKLNCFRIASIFIFPYLSDWHDIVSLKLILKSPSRNTFLCFNEAFSSDFSNPSKNSVSPRGDSKDLRQSNLIQLLLLSRYFQLVHCLNIVSGRTLSYLQYKERIRFHPVQLDLCLLVF